MDKTTIKQRTVSILKLCFPKTVIDSDLLEYVDFIDDLGMDSITFISLIVELESDFHIHIPDHLLLMENFRNMNMTIDHLNSLLAAPKRENEGEL